MACVLDNGSGMIKSGIAGVDETPKVFPSVVGSPRMQGVMGMAENVVGNEAETKRGLLKLSYPIEHGVITNWDEMEKIWKHAFYKELQIAPEEHTVVLTESPTNPSNNREKMAQIMFETFNVAGIYATAAAVLALYSTGRRNGVVLDSGASITNSVPIKDGYVVSDAVLDLKLAGRDLTAYIATLLNNSGTSVEREIAVDIKEKLCFVAMNKNTDQTSTSTDLSISHNYSLPDGNIITASSELYQCPEALFQPSLMAIKTGGIHDLTFSSIKKCKADLQQELFQNVVLSGGNTMFKGIEGRMQKELSTLAGSSIEVKIIAPAERKYAAWKGGSMLASLSTFAEMCITKSQYNEFGASIINKKCPLSV